jgi:hypothetical protein
VRRAREPGRGELMAMRRALDAAAVAVAAVFVLLGGGALAEVVQSGEVRVTFLSQIAPYKLPRQETAPITVFVAGHVASTGGGVPPQLKRMRIEVNRHGLLRSKGLPACHLSQVATASTAKALEICGPALIGSGRFWAHIVLPDQSPYPTQGRLLIFNGRSGSRRTVLAHIFTSSPFPSSFVVPFTVSRIAGGTYGTLLTAPLPQALGDWGYVDRIKLNLKRRYRFRGRELSYFNASCPAPAGANGTAFPLARTSFYFEGRSPVRAAVVKACGVRR